jgi:isocitrate dehydrogenase
VLTVADIMTRQPVTLGPQATVAQALDTMKVRGISSVLVSPPSGITHYGISTMRDIVTKVVTNDLDPDAIHLGDIATWRLVTVDPLWTIQPTAQLMATANVRRLPVVEGSRLLGLVSDTDIFIALVQRQEWEHVRVLRKERAWQRAGLPGQVKWVSDLMSTPVLAIGTDAPVQAAVEKMVASGISSLLATSTRDSLQGIVTKRDVVTKVVEDGTDPKQVKVHALMSSPLKMIGPDVSIAECSARMASEGVRRFPVERRGEIIGIISDSDILAAVASHRWWGQPGRKWPTSYIVADIMKTPPAGSPVSLAQAVSPELSMWDCAAKLADSRLKELPVVQQGKVIGVVGRADVLRALEERGGAH